MKIFRKPVAEKVRKTKEEKAAEKEEEDRIKDLIIVKVQNKPLLYDKANPGFKNVCLKNEAWAEIATALEISRLDAMKIWRSLREAFNRELNLQKLEAVSGARASRRTPFPFLGQMRFLEPFIRRRESICTTENDQGDDISEDGYMSHLISNTQEDNIDIQTSIANMSPKEEFPMSFNEEHEENSNCSLRVYRPEIKDRTFEEHQLPASSSKEFETLQKRTANTQMSNSLSKVPVLTHPRDKNEETLSSELVKCVGILIQATADSHKESPDELLGASIGRALASIPNAPVKNKWKRKFRELLSDMEDDLAEMEDTD